MTKECDPPSLPALAWHFSWDALNPPLHPLNRFYLQNSMQVPLVASKKFPTCYFSTHLAIRSSEERPKSDEYLYLSDIERCCCVVGTQKCLFEWNKNPWKWLLVNLDGFINKQKSKIFLGKIYKVKTWNLKNILFS